MDIENLKRANEIQEELVSLGRASDIISEGRATVTIFHGKDSDDYVVLASEGFCRALRDCIDQFITVLLEEAKTL